MAVTTELPGSTPRAVPAVRRTPTAGHHTGFWLVALAFLAMASFAALPTPLYALFQRQDGFATPVITVVFAVYALGVGGSLYLVGHVSDWVGRRRMTLLATGVEILAAVVFLVWPELPGLLLARVLTGIGIGMLTATATAHLGELWALARPAAGPATAGTVASLVSLGGFGLGPLVAGVLAQFAPHPLVVPFVVFLVVLAATGLGSALVPETVTRPAEPRRWTPQRVRLPAGARTAFFVAAIGAAVAFAVNGMFMALSPSILAQVMGQTSRLAAGLVPFAVFGSAAVVPVLMTRFTRRQQLTFALVASVAGAAALAVGVLAADLPTFVAAGVVAGAAAGTLFRSAVATAAMLADPAGRGEVLAALFLIAYAGLALPVLAIGLALVWLPLVPVIVGFAAIVLVLTVVSTGSMLRR
jgi:MFS family permease